MIRFYKEPGKLLEQLKEDSFIISEENLIILGNSLSNCNDTSDLYYFFYILDITLDRDLIISGILKNCSLPTFYSIKNDIKANKSFRELMNSSYVRRLNRFKNIINLYLKED